MVGAGGGTKLLTRAGGGITASISGLGRATMCPSEGGTYGRTCAHPASRARTAMPALASRPRAFLLPPVETSGCIALATALCMLSLPCCGPRVAEKLPAAHYALPLGLGPYPADRPHIRTICTPRTRKLGEFLLSLLAARKGTPQHIDHGSTLRLATIHINVIYFNEF